MVLVSRCGSIYNVISSSKVVSVSVGWWVIVLLIVNIGYSGSSVRVMCCSGRYCIGIILLFMYVDCFGGECCGLDWFDVVVVGVDLVCVMLFDVV